MKKVLVLDGFVGLQDVVERLKREEYEVTVASFDAEAFERIKDFGPDVVVINLSLPNAYGRSLMSVIKTDPTLSVTPIVVCTEPTSEVEQLIKDLARMKLYVIHTPCSADDVIAKTKQALGEV